MFNHVEICMKCYLYTAVLKLIDGFVLIRKTIISICVVTVSFER